MRDNELITVDCHLITPDQTPVQGNRQIGHRRQQSSTTFNLSEMNRSLLSPAVTPANRVQKSGQRRQRSQDASAARSKAVNRMSMSNNDFSGLGFDGFNANNGVMPTNLLPSPPSSTGHTPSNSIDLTNLPDLNQFNISQMGMNFPTGENNDVMGSSQPMMASASISSFHSAPDIIQGQFLEDPFGIVQEPSASMGTSPAPSQSMIDFGNFDMQSNRVERAKSAFQKKLEECITDTGITDEEISKFIQGPDSFDGKFSCNYPDCGKRFGRKENVRAHVQTHLGDRQYRCDECQKCFVRQHDLKRHAKIHSGTKPYPCACGNSFARQDALTRHRQRGMCIGAFEGVVRKEVKRGRPRKNRPEAEERIEKATKTRNNAKAKSPPMTSIETNEIDPQLTSAESPPMTSIETDDLDLRLANALLADSIADNQGMDPFCLTAEDLLSKPLGPEANFMDFLPSESPESSSTVGFSPDMIQSDNSAAQSYAPSPADLEQVDNTDEAHLSMSPALTADKSTPEVDQTPPELCMPSDSPAASEASSVEDSPEDEAATLMRFSAAFDNFLPNLNMAQADDDVNQTGPTFGDSASLEHTDEDNVIIKDNSIPFGLDQNDDNLPSPSFSEIFGEEVHNPIYHKRNVRGF